MRRGREEVRGVREGRARVEGVLGGFGGEVGEVGREEWEGEGEGRVEGGEAVVRRERKKREEGVVWEVIHRDLT